MEFTYCKLIDILSDIHSGGTPSTDISHYWGGTLKWLSSGETSQRFINDTIDKITEAGVKNSSTKLAKKNNIVMACAGQGKTRGQTSFLLDDMYINQSVIALEPKDTVLPLYLFYDLSSRYEELRIGSDASSTRGSITTTALKSLPFKYPNLDTQKRIVDILSTYDYLIENNRRRIVLFEKMAQELYKEWFVRLRFPDYKKKIFKDNVSVGFEYKTVEQISEVLQRGISPTYDDNGKYCVISQKCIRKNIMDISEARKQSKEFKPVLNLRDGDTVICSTGTGTLGRVGQVYGDYPDTTFDSHVTLVRAKNNIGKHFLFYSLKNLQPWFMNMGIGSTNQQELYKKTIQKAKILVPDTALMKSFEEHIEQIHKQIIALSKANDNLIKQRDLLLPRLMSGKLEV